MLRRNVTETGNPESDPRRLRQQQFDEKWRAEYLLEIGFQLRAEPETTNGADSHPRRAIESFEVCGIDGHLPDFFNVGRMSQSGERVAIKQLKHLECHSPRRVKESRRAG